MPGTAFCNLCKSFATELVNIFQRDWSTGTDPTSIRVIFSRPTLFQLLDVIHFPVGTPSYPPFKMFDHLTVDLKVKEKPIVCAMLLPSFLTVVTISFDKIR